MAPATKIKKPFRVTQFEKLSEAGLILCPTARSRNVPQECWTRDFRWRWTARIAAFLSTGTSAGLGLRTFSSSLVDLRTKAA